MAELETVADALRLAIMREGYACELYKQLRLSADDPELQDLFRDLAEEELEHKRKLEFELLKQGCVSKPIETEISLSAIEYLDELPPPKGMDYAEVMLFGIAKERTSFQFYSLLAGAVEDKELQDGFLALAEEEARHLVRFEDAYREATSSRG